MGERIRTGLREQSLNRLLILASDSNCSRGVERGPLAQWLRPCLPLPTCFTLLTFALPLLTLTHPILPIKQPCSPFRIETDFVKVRIQVKQPAVICLISISRIKSLSPSVARNVSDTISRTNCRIGISLTSHEVAKFQVHLSTRIRVYSLMLGSVLLPCGLGLEMRHCAIQSPS